MQKDCPAMAALIMTRINQLLVENEEYLRQRKEEEPSEGENDKDKRDPCVEDAHSKNVSINKSKESEKTPSQSTSKSVAKPVKGKTKNKLSKQSKELLEDAPLDGPSVYVALSGFYNTALIEELIRIEVPLACIVKLASSGADEDNDIDSVSNRDVDPNLRYRIVKKSASQDNHRDSEISTFWDDFETNRYDLIKSKHLKNTANINYFPPDSEKAESLDYQSKVIYDEICELFYDLNKLQLEHKSYLDKMLICDVECKDTVPGMENYMDEVSGMPNDAISAAVVLHCILHQVHKTMTAILEKELEVLLISQEEMIQCNETEEMFIDVESVSCNLDYDCSNPSAMAKQHLQANDLFSIEENDKPEIKLNRAKMDQKALQLQQYHGVMNETARSHLDEKDITVSSQQTILSFGNTIERKTFHLKNAKILHITENMLRHMLLAKLFIGFPLDEPETLKFGYHMDKLAQFIDFGQVSMEMYKRVLHLMVFDKMQHRNAKVKAYVRHKWSKSRSSRIYSTKNNYNESVFSINRKPIPYKFQFHQQGEDVFECPDISSLIHNKHSFDRNKNVISPLDNMDKCIYSEPMQPLVLLQTLQRAFSEFNNVNFEYFGPTDSMLVWFNNPKALATSWCQEVHLEVPICFRDFCDFVLDEVHERNKYAYNSNTKDVNTESEDWRIYGDSSFNSTGTSRKRSSIKTYSINQTNLKHVGYNLTDVRYQLVTEETEFFAARTRLLVRLVEVLYEKVNVELSISLNNHYLFHSVCISDYKRDPIQFHVIHKNGIIIAFRKHHIDDDKAKAVQDQSKYVEKTDDKNKNCIFIPTKINEEIVEEEIGEEVEEEDTAYRMDMRFKCSYPNGLSIELVECDNQPYYIRQILPKECNTSSLKENQTKEDTHAKNTSEQEAIKNIPHIGIIKYTKEEKRAYLRNGIVIAFNIDGSVVLFCADGTIFWASAVDVKLLTNPHSIMYKSMDGYSTITAEGRQIIKGYNGVEEMQKLALLTATDYDSDEVFIKREDGTNLFFTSSSLVTAFPDGTRITTYCIIHDGLLNVNEYGEDTETEPWVSLVMTCLFEHKDYATVFYDENQHSVITMPDDVTVKTNLVGETEVVLDNSTVLNVFSRYLNFDCCVCKGCNSFTKVGLNYSDDYVPDILFQCVDSFDKIFYVDSDGKCMWDKDYVRLTRDNCEKKNWCRLPLPHEMNTHFVIKRNMEGERIHEGHSIDSHIRRMKDMCGTNYSEFTSTKDGVECIQILNPLGRHPTKRWQTKFEPVLPTTLTFKDLFATTHRGWFRLSRGSLKNDGIRPVKQSFDVLSKSHFCKVPVDAIKHVRGALTSYRNWGKLQRAKWRTLCLPSQEFRGPTNLRIEHRLAHAAMGALLVMKDSIRSGSNYSDKSEVGSIYSNDYNQQAVKAQEIAIRREHRYYETLQGHLVSPFQKYLL